MVCSFVGRTRSSPTAQDLKSIQDLPQFIILSAHLKITACRSQQAEALVELGWVAW